jgi:hypothetical protein
MSHPVYPTFPTSPAPTLGQIFDSGQSGVWQFTSIGWVKRVVDLNSVNPIWPGQVTSTGL